MLNIPNWTTKQVTVNGADVNTSVTFTKNIQKTGINIIINYEGSGVTLKNLTIKLNGKLVEKGLNELAPGNYTVDVSAIGYDNQGNYIPYRVLGGNPKTFTVSNGNVTDAVFGLAANGIN